MHHRRADSQRSCATGDDAIAILGAFSPVATFSADERYLIVMAPRVYTPSGAGDLVRMYAKEDYADLGTAVITGTEEAANPLPAGTKLDWPWDCCADGQCFTKVGGCACVCTALSAARLHAACDASPCTLKLQARNRMICCCFCLQ